MITLFKKVGPNQVQLDTQKLDTWIMVLFLMNLFTLAISIAAYARTL